jgi:hypothetical protein
VSEARSTCRDQGAEQVTVRPITEETEQTFPQFTFARQAHVGVEPQAAGKGKHVCVGVLPAGPATVSWQ